GSAVEVGCLIVAVELLVRLAGEVDGGGFAAAVAEPALDDGGALAAGQRVGGLALGQLDSGLFGQPVRLPHVVVAGGGDLEGGLDRRPGLVEAAGAAICPGEQEQPVALAE